MPFLHNLTQCIRHFCRLALILCEIPYDSYVLIFRGIKGCCRGDLPVWVEWQSILILGWELLLSQWTHRNCWGRWEVVIMLYSLFNRLKRFQPHDCGILGGCSRFIQNERRSSLFHIGITVQGDVFGFFIDWDPPFGLWTVSSAWTILRFLGLQLAPIDLSRFVHSFLLLIYFYT